MSKSFFELHVNLSVIFQKERGTERVASDRLYHGCMRILRIGNKGIPTFQALNQEN